MLSIGYGFMIGVFVSLIGGGGASLYLGVLTSQLGLATAVAVPTSLFVALPALFLGFLTQVRIHNVNFKLGNQLLLTAIPGILAGALLAKYITAMLYNRIVGVILLVMGIIVVVKALRPGKQQDVRQSGWIASLFGLLSGLMVGIGGLSGGATTTAAGLAILGLSALQAAGTATYVLWVMSAIGLAIHLITSTVDWSAGMGLMVGAIIGSIGTPLVLHRLNTERLNRWLMPFLGVIISYFGWRMLV
ncbi:sulfite exporter TauE/SafE family protein [Levilactobacillus brevis]|uniref:sulfite exporter TauE/SafE family protein n=1 Tax=Levilactobacillus brevis TaxID=1580 RepID=UPI0035128B7B